MRERQLKNAYIGEYIPRTPDPTRTRFYFPFESNANDYSGRTDITITNTSTNVTYASLGGIMCANANGSSSKILFSPNGIINKNTDSYATTSILFNANTYTTGTGSGAGGYTKIYEWAVQNVCYQSANFATGSILDSVSTEQRHHFVQTSNKSTGEAKQYLDGVLKNTYSLGADAPRGNWANSYEQGQYMFCKRSGTYQRFNGGVREFLGENIEWTQEQIVEYYNWIKKKLGI